jgi:hypothetical protein
MIRPRDNGRRLAELGLSVGGAGVDNAQLVAAAVDGVELPVDLSLEPDFSLEPDLSLEADLSRDPVSPDEDPLLEPLVFLPDSRLSVR